MTAYWESTVSYGIYYTGYPKVLEGYCDANWISDADEDDIVVTQKSKRQRTIKYFGDDYIVYLVDDTKNH